MRYLFCLIGDIVMEILALLLSPILPLFARNAMLPHWLSWFMTPDYTLEGDPGWQTGHWQWRYRLPPLLCRYVGYFGWLLRNRAYGFKWTVIAAPVRQRDLSYTGDITIKNRDHARAGVLHCEMSPYWQYKRVWKIPGQTLCVMLNFGWQLDNYITNPRLYETLPHALFMFSPRISAFHPDPV